MSIGYSCSLNDTMLDLINGSLRASYSLYKERDNIYELTLPDLERLHRFQKRTLVAISAHDSKSGYTNGIVGLLSQVRKTDIII